MADEIYPGLGIIRAVSLDSASSLQRPVLYHPITWHGIPVESIRAAHDCEVGQRDLVRIAVDDRRHAKVAGVDAIMTDMQLEVAAVVELAPLEFSVVGNQCTTRVVGCSNSDILTRRRRRRHRCSSKFNAM